MPRNVSVEMSIVDIKIKKSRNRNSLDLHSLKELYSLKKVEICRRLEDFKKLWLIGTDEDIFAELAFCILTPQSKAKACWKAIEGLKLKNLLYIGSTEEIRREIKDVRFKNKKSAYLVGSRKLFLKNGGLCIKSLIGGFKDIHKCREWLVKNVKGIGYKEASHFLRNIGFGDEIAILDRHILKNLKEINIIKDIPESLSKSQYLRIEKKMSYFSKKIDIPLLHLDLLFWYKETGEIFK